MAECYKCGVSDENERLFDAISNKGVIKLCKYCSDEEKLPLVQPVDLNKPEKSQSVYERLSVMAKLDPEKHKRVINEKQKEDEFKRKRNLFSREQDMALKKIVETNLEKKKIQHRTDLIPNFHWIIMRNRRLRKLTQKQLAENIGESESLIKNAEEGVILNNTDAFVRKIENYFGIKLRNDESVYESNGISKKEAMDRLEKEGNFNKDATDALTIADLKEMDDKKKSEGSGGFFSFLKRNKKRDSLPSEEEQTSKEEDSLPEKETDNSAPNKGK